MSRDLKGRIIIITGASAGIGAATAQACAAAGMTVVAAARRSDRLSKIESLCRQSGARCGGTAQAVACDVRDGDQVRRLASDAWERYGRLDAVFANAGYGLFAPVADTTESQMRAIFETNFFGTLHALWAAVPLMRRQGRGHLLICSSAISEIGIPMYGAYAATKAAQDAIACSLRAELADENIYVSSVHPIGTKTEFFDVVRQLSALNGHLYNTPAALSQSPERVARAVVRCLRRPCPEVWPCRSVRLGLAITTAVPGLSAWAMRRMHHRRFPKRADPAPTDSSPL